MSLKKNPIVRFLLFPYIYWRRNKERKSNKKAANLFVEFTSRIKSGSVVFSFTDFLGDFEIGIHSTLLGRMFRFNSYEKKLTELIKAHLDTEKDAIDIGANIGLFSVLLSKLINDNKVLAIEPTPKALRFLRSNVSRNNCDENIIIHSGIVTNKKGAFSLNTIDGLEEYSSLGKLVHNYIKDEKSDSITVQGDTLDNIVKHYNIKPGFIKIDVEGAEFLAFQGAKNTIKEYKPIILSEISEQLLKNQGSSSGEVFTLLKGFGYYIYNTENLTPINANFEGDIIAFPYKI